MQEPYVDIEEHFTKRLEEELKSEWIRNVFNIITPNLYHLWSHDEKITGVIADFFQFPNNETYTKLYNTASAKVQLELLQKPCKKILPDVPVLEYLYYGYS
jgi:hypothetical protein